MTPINININQGGYEMKVLGARCIVREEKLDEATKSGIVIPGRDKVQTNRGTIIAVGSGAILENGVKIPMEVAVGDRVIYTSFSGTPIVTSNKDHNETFIILNERDILAVLDNTDK